MRASDVEREPADVLSEVDALAAAIARVRISQAGSPQPIGGSSTTSSMYQS